MRIHVHDGSGHFFPVQLSRELARRGHDVHHTYSSQWLSAHGRLERLPDDPPSLRIEAITADCEYDKYSPLKRARWELAYARAWQRVLDREPCDVVIVCNTQLFTAASMRRYFTRRSQPWVLWHQDISCFGVADEIARKLPRAVGGPLAAAAIREERKLVRDATAVVAIGTPFLEQYREWGLPLDNAHVIPNWAPLDEITPGYRDEGWAASVGLAPTGVRLLYAGTLGRKHNPQLLADLLGQVRARGLDAQLVVASEGPGADHLRAAADASPHLSVVGFQPAEELSAMLRGADVLLAILEPEASRFSIPSKVLSYFAAGRPVMAFVPAANPCVADITAAGGYAREPSDSAVSDGAEWIAEILQDQDKSLAIGRRARAHAESRFDIGDIGDEFERVLSRAGTGRELRFA